MKDYYEILCIERFASATEVKRAYRRLAVQYHPDKNPDVAVEPLFKEINEAYEVLGDPQRKALYDLALVAPESMFAEQKPAHRDPAYRRRSDRPVYKSERQRMLETMASLLPAANYVVYFCLAVSLFLAADYILPFASRTERIVETELRKTRRNVPSEVIVITDRGTILEVTLEVSRAFMTGKQIHISSTRLLNIPVIFAGESGSMRVRKSIYGNFSFAPITLFLTSCFGIYHRKKIEYGFNSGVVASLVLFLTVIFYIVLH